MTMLVALNCGLVPILSPPWDFEQRPTPEIVQRLALCGAANTFGRWKKNGAGEGARTLDPDLGKVVLYH